jgi:hypothetical protein
MLFDLRSRGRKTAVRVIYLSLAAIMIVGLVLFGVGTGASGILNNSNGGGGTNGNSTGKQVQKAMKQVQDNPDSSAAWASLYEAQMINAQSGGNVTGSHNEPTKPGVHALKAAELSWQKYLKLTNEKPNTTYSSLAGKMYTTLALTGASGAWDDAASAWQYMIQSIPSSQKGSLITPYQCLALTSYAGKQTQKAELAAAQAKQLAKQAKIGVALTSQLTESLAAAKKSTRSAAQYALAYCSTMSS